MTTTQNSLMLTRELLGEMLESEVPSLHQQGKVWKVLITIRSLKPKCTECSTQLYQAGARGPRFECRAHKTRFAYGTMVIDAKLILEHYDEIMSSRRAGPQIRQILEILFEKLEPDTN